MASASLKSRTILSDGRLMTREPSLHRGQEIEISLQNELGDAVHATLSDDGRLVVLVHHEGTEHRLVFDRRKT